MHIIWFHIWCASIFDINCIFICLGYFWLQLLKNENGELVRRLNQSRNEVKVNQIRYEKLEKAFAESIQKIMTNSDDDSRRS